MRALVLALALLAGLKIWAQDSMYRSATDQALISAYRDRAVLACQAAPQKVGGSSTLAGVSVNWARSTEERLVIGNPHLSVYPWEVEHELWNARYKTAYLILNSPAGMDCVYDLAIGTAQVYRS